MKQHKKPKKTITGILMVAMCLAVFAGCSGASSTKSSSSSDWTATDANKPKTIVILSASDGPTGDKWLSPYFPEFEKSTGVKIDYTELGQDALHTRLAILFAAKSTDVDMLWTYDNWTAEFGSAGDLADLTNVVPKTEWNTFVPGSLTSITYKDKRYGMPRFLSIRSLFYNSALLQQAGSTAAPTDWDQFVAIAKKTTDASKGQYGVLLGAGNNNSLSLTFQDMLMMTGGSYIDNNDNVKINDKNGVLALQKLVELCKDGVVDPASFGVINGDTKRAKFIQGKDAMMWEWAPSYTSANDPTQSSIVGKMKPALIPKINQTGAITGSEAYAISQYSANKAWDLKFLRFVTSDSVQKRMSMKVGWEPVKTSVFNDKDLISSSPMIDIAKEQSKYPTYRFAEPYGTEIDNTVSPAILNAMQGKVDPQKALDDAAAACKTIIQQYK